MIDEPPQPPTQRSLREDLWQPDELKGEEPLLVDTYLVVDDKEDHLVRLVAAAWPSLDEVGRLEFSAYPGVSGDESVALVFADESGFLAMAEDARQRHQQLPREIRIGDCFWVRGFSGDDPLSFEDLIDVTASARVVAKIALYSAIAPKVDRREADALELLGEDQEPPERPTGPAAAPVI